MPRFLSQEWVDAIEAQMNANDQIIEFAGWAFITIEHVATDAPDGGEIRHWRRYADGRVEVQLGAAEAPDATLTSSYEDAVAINRGELDLMGAFSGGKLKVDGDVSKLLQYQAEFTEVAETVHSVPTDY